jgi:hypothetical protein
LGPNINSRVTPKDIKVAITYDVHNQLRQAAYTSVLEHLNNEIWHRSRLYIYEWDSDDAHL